MPGVQKKIFTLAEAAAKLPVTDFLDYRQYLKDLYEVMKENRDPYSFELFSDELGLSKSNVSWLIITNRRKLTLKNFKKLCQALDIKHKSRNYFELLVQYNNCRKPIDQQNLLEKLLKLKSDLIEDSDQNTLEYYSEWYYPVIRELIGLEGFTASADWIAKHLHCRLLPQQIDNAINLLLKLNLISWDAHRNRFVQTGGQVSPNRQASKLAALRYHERMLQIALESLNRIPVSERDYNCMTLRLPPSRMEEAKTILHDALSTIFALESEAGVDGEELFQINVQLFPLTRGN